MAPADLLAVLRHKPFRRFRLVTSDGTSLEVRHPDLVFVTIGSAIVGYPDEREPALAAKYDIVSLRHIVRLELEEDVATQPPNGQDASA
jgi:hypothetical protein